jgi:filamentous hemagglutinin family protein
MTMNKLPPAPQRALMRKCMPLLLAACFSAAQATPTLPQVVSGQASFAQQGNVFSITNTPNTIINWQSFSVNAGEVTRFIQQSADSAVLNRILGQDPSQILGALQSNGHVFLINPNGIMFGRDARVDVKGLTASTLALSNNDFLAGKKNFHGGPGAGSIANQGKISTASGGQVFLIAPNVDNSGIITSPQGQVVLAAGHSVQLVDSGNPDLHVVVSAPVDQSINLGQIIAEGGRVGIYGALVKQRGVVSANSAQIGANGKIVFKASGDAFLEAGSVTSATGAGDGGEVSVQGTRVALTGDARIDASGVSGGGTVLVGGGYQGKNPAIMNAQQALLGGNASIKADATDAGKGGTVVVWADGSARALGSISAQGEGGLVETSGKAFLDVNGVRVKSGGRNGVNGTWLLDPTNIEIIAGAGTASNLTEVDQFADPELTPTTINVSLINSAASGTDIVLQANNDITFSTPVTATLGSGSLTALAGGNINVYNSVSTGGGNLVLKANNAGGVPTGSGTVTLDDSTINTGGGTLLIEGATVWTNDVISTVGGSLTINATTLANLDGGLNSAGGVLAVTAPSISLGGSTTFDSGTGAMSFHASSGSFVSGISTALKSDADILIRANAVSMDGTGTIAPSTTVKPSLTFRTANQSTAMLLQTGGGGGLVLDPVVLKTYNVDKITIGSATETGALTVTDIFAPAVMNQLKLTTQGNIAINNDITLLGSGSNLHVQVEGSNASGSITVATGAPLTADSITLGANNIIIADAITGSSAFGSVYLAPHMAGATIGIGSGAADAANVLGLSTSELNMIDAHQVEIGGQAGQTGGVAIVNAGADLSGYSSTGKLVIKSGAGALTLHGTLTSAGALELYGQDLQTASGKKAIAPSIILEASYAIGAPTAAFNTETSTLSASNSNAGGSQPINISNVGASPISLNLQSAIQDGAGNQGNITVLNYGAMSLAETDPRLDGDGGVRTGGNGTITLKTQSPLTLLGDIDSVNGAITLEAGNGGALTIGANSAISAGAGNISIVAGSVVNNGSVASSSGSIAVTAVTVSGGGSFAAPVVTGVAGTPVTPPEPEPPTVSECLTRPTAAGCGQVMEEALDACIVNPSGPDCAAVLPTVPVCVSAPTTLGCAVVLPTLDVCVAAPTTPGCSVVLPSVDACVSAPTSPGCSVVLPSLPACVANPASPGCTVVLPPLASCVTTPTLPGCSVVLPSISVCVATPSATGCSVVLPSLQSCIVTPTAAGCSVVLPTLATCIATPTAAGCSAVLPTLSACIVNPTAPGCATVLPTLNACITTPTLAGCTVVLPTLSACVLNPSAPGCAVVLPTLSQCITTPSASGCSVVLPTLAQCVSNPTAMGCNAVLPTLSQCVAAPSSAGCSVVLPTLAQCTTSPTLQGCSVVLPPVSACVANPTAPGCVVVVPPTQPEPNSPIARETNTTIQLINSTTVMNSGAFAPPKSYVTGGSAGTGSTGASSDTSPTGSGGGTGGNSEPDKAGAKTDEKKDASSDKIGVKDEVRKKTYCN